MVMTPGARSTAAAGGGLRAAILERLLSRRAAVNARVNARLNGVAIGRDVATCSTLWPASALT
jgi:hypothetical protein